jgi:hypothetical protein
MYSTSPCIKFSVELHGCMDRVAKLTCRRHRHHRKNCDLNKDQCPKYACRLQRKLSYGTSHLSTHGMVSARTCGLFVTAFLLPPVAVIVIFLSAMTLEILYYTYHNAE